MIDVIEISISVNGTRATISEQIYSNNANQYRALVKFENDAWDNYDKVIVFDRVKNYDTPIGIMVNKDNSDFIEIVDDKSFYCVIPWEVLTQPGYFTVSIYGTSGESQKSIMVKDKFTIYDGGNTTVYPRVPTPNMYEQLVTIMKEVSDKVDTNTKSDAGRTTPEGGEIFNDYETNQALGLWSHVEGGRCNDPEGVERHNIAKGVRAHIEGSGNIVTESTYDAHVEGSLNVGSHNQVHVEGYGNTASEHQAHAEGNSTIASGIQSHTEGWKTVASGNQSHAEGTATEASGEQSHTEGNSTIASGARAHAEGNNTDAIGINSHAEGQETIADGFCSHAEGLNSYAKGNHSHAEGQSTLATGQNSHAEGNNTESISASTHAEGSGTYATGSQAHSEGYKTIASGEQSHSEGHSTTASGARSHAGGLYSEAKGTQSFVHGTRLIATESNQFIVGKFNDEAEKGLFVVGNGIGNSWDGTGKVGKNAFVVKEDGTATIQTAGTNDNNVVNYKQLKDYVSKNSQVTSIDTTDLEVKRNLIKLGHDTGSDQTSNYWYSSILTNTTLEFWNNHAFGSDYLSIDKNKIEKIYTRESHSNVSITWDEIFELPTIIATQEKTIITLENKISSLAEKINSFVDVSIEGR